MLIGIAKANAAPGDILSNHWCVSYPSGATNYTPTGYTGPVEVTRDLTTGLNLFIVDGSGNNIALYKTSGTDLSYFKSGWTLQVFNTTGGSLTGCVDMVQAWETVSQIDAANSTGTLPISSAQLHSDLTGTLTVSCSTGCSGGGGSGGTVTLSTHDNAVAQDSRQLLGWIVGVLLVLMFAPVIFKLWNSRGL